MRAFAFLVALLSMAMAQAFLAPAALNAPRVVSDDRERQEEEQEEAERGRVVGCWGMYVCAAAVDAELPGNDVYSHSSAAATRGSRRYGIA